MKIATDIIYNGIEIPLTVNVTAEINQMPANQRMDKILDFLLSIDLTDVNLSDWYIAEFRKKMIALNAKFKFKSIEIAELFLSWYIEKIEVKSYIDTKETFKNFIKEMGKPKI
jgi:hypothetical protein